MIQYPKLLTPTSTERFTLSGGNVVEIPKATPTFRRWAGPAPQDTYGGKVVVEANGAPAFAELAILRLFEAEGYEGVWVDTYRNKYRRGYWGEPPVATLPEHPATILGSILNHRGGGRSGTWDVFAWRGEDVVFAESKHAGKDAIRTSQVTWLSSALAQGHPLSAFLVVEWTLE